MSKRGDAGGSQRVPSEAQFNHGLRSMAIAAARLLWSTAGALVAMLLVLQIADAPGHVLMLGSLGGSTVFLFGLPRTAPAQPRALFGGHLGGALVGVLCYQAFGAAPWVYALAVALTLVLMLVTKTVHPPAGADPLIMVHAHAGWFALWQPVFVSVALLALVAAAWSRVLPGTVRYPNAWFVKSPPSALWGAWD